MEMFLVTHSLKEFLRIKRLVPWLALLLFTYTLGHEWGYLSPTSTPADQYSQVSSILVFRILALASAFYTTAIVSQEVEQKTIVYLLTRPIPRWKLLLTRFAASVIVVGAISVASVLVLSVAVYGSHAFSNPLLGKDVLALLVGTFAYGGLFLFVSLLFNRSMLICLLFAFGWETSVPNLPGELYRISVFSYLQAIAEHPQVSGVGQRLTAFVSGSLGTNTLSSGTSYFSMAVLTTVTLIAGAWWFTRFEYVPREDAE